MNNIVLIGRLTKDIELRYTQSGLAIGSSVIAVARDYKNKDGSITTDFINIEVMGKTAENCSNYIGKGSLIGIQGSLKIDRYEKDGQKLSYTKVGVNKIQFLDKRGSVENKGGEMFTAVNDEDVPF